VIKILVVANAKIMGLTNDLNRLFWELIEDEVMDNTGEELLILMLEREQQFESFTKP